MNKKGGAMVEASLVYPLVILSIAATMMILSFLLVEGMTQVHVHNSLRNEIGSLTETFRTDENKGSSNENVGFDKSFGGFHSILHGHQLVELHGAGLLPRLFQKTIDGRGLLIDEQKYIRYMDLFMPEVPDDE